MAAGMLPTDSTLTIYDAQNNQVATVTPQQAQRFNQMLQNGGGQSTLVTIGQAVQVGGDILEALNLREIVRDAQDAQTSLHTARQAVKDYLTSSGTTVVDPSKLSTLLQNVWDAQDDVDNAQTDATSAMVDSLWINAFGAGATALGGMQGGMAGAMGGATTTEALLAGGAVGLLAATFVQPSSQRRSSRRFRVR